MKDLRTFFNYMNDISFPYLVMRNWDMLPDSVELGDHSDLDLLVDSYEQFFEIFPDAKLEFPNPRVRVKMAIGDSYIFMDVRFIGDGYYPADFEASMMKSREWNEKGFFTPDSLHHRLGIAYHIVHHRGGMTLNDDYRKYVGDATVKELLEALKKSNIGWVPPTDKSVGTYNGYWKGATSVVAKTDGAVVKKQTGFMAYGLIENEKRILSMLDSEHFPKVISDGEDGLMVEDCGDLLTIDNLPSNWKEQLVRIVYELKSAEVQHRDIKPSNLCVKNNIIKLIDMGWAIKIGEKDTPPACLGYPYRPSDGYSDDYSMIKVIKEFEFQLEEKQEQLIGSI